MTPAATDAVPAALDAGARRRLLDAARGAIAAELGAATPHPPGAGGGLDAAFGVFVTVRRGEVLRGCRGVLETDAPLYETVPEVARLSAFADPRFHPLKAEELDELEVEISLLFRRRPLAGPDDLVLGRDGVLLSVDGRRGFLLPQVAVEHGFDAEAFLDALCQKAGVPSGSWRRDDARLEAFEVAHFGSAGAER